MAAAAVLSAGKVGEIEAGAGAAGRPARPGAAVDAAIREVASAAVAGTVRTAGVRRPRTAVAVAGIGPAAVPRRPNAAAAPSSSRPPAAPVRPARASVATAAASPVVAEDAPPWTSEAEAAEGCSPVGILPRAVAAQAAEVDDPSAVPGSTEAAAEVQPSHDA